MQPIDIYRIDSLVKAFSKHCGDGQYRLAEPSSGRCLHLLNVTTRGREGEGRRGEDWSDSLQTGHSCAANLFEPLQSEPLPPPPMKEHSKCLIDRAASSSIYYKISMMQPYHAYLESILPM
jgi:hypothetical protein